MSRIEIGGETGRRYRYSMPEDSCQMARRSRSKSQFTNFSKRRTIDITCTEHCCLPVPFCSRLAVKGWWEITQVYKVVTLTGVGRDRIPHAEQKSYLSSITESQEKLEGVMARC